MHPLLRLPYAALGTAAELAVALAPDATNDAPKWRRALAARRGVEQRLEEFAAERDTTRPLVWFHAPSVGETLMALPVMQGLRAHPRSPQIALTWFSPSAESFAARVDADFRDYLAFDTRRAARRALDALRPHTLVFAKLDVWPVLAAEAASRGVRMGLIAATLSAKSGRQGAFARALLHDAYACLDFVGAASQDDADRLATLGVPGSRITVTGDTRFDQVWARVASLDRTKPPAGLLWSERPTLVAGSTWPADEAVLQPAWERVRRDVPGARLIIAPHEPTLDHLAGVASWAGRAGLTVARLSEPGASRADVVLVDTVGVLAELYAAGTAAYVGGGFHDAGLHSVVEPAALGLPVIFGPNGAWDRDGAGLAGAGGAKVAPNADSLAETVRSWLSDPSERDRVGSSASAFVRSGLGAAARTLRLVSAGL